MSAHRPQGSDAPVVARWARGKRAHAAASGSSADWRGRLPFFYGWLIVAGSLLALGVTYSVMYSFSVFYVALLEEFGWGRGETAGIYSAFMIVTGIGALVSHLCPWSVKRVLCGRWLILG